MRPADGVGEDCGHAAEVKAALGEILPRGGQPDDAPLATPIDEGQVGVGLFQIPQ